MRARSLGELVGTSFSLAADRFGPLFVVLLVCAVIPGAIQAFFIPAPPTIEAQMGQTPEEVFAWMSEFFGGFAVLLVVAAVVYPLQAGACVLIAGLPFRGQERSLRQVFGTALRRYPQLLLLSVAFGLLSVLGTFVFCVGQFVVAAIFFVAIPVMMFEDRGWLDSLQRARALTAGHFWEVLAVHLATRLGMGFVLAPFLMIVQLLLQDHYHAMVFVQVFFQQVGETVPVVAPAVVYFHLRVVKEHHDLQVLAELIPVVGERGAAEAARGAGRG
jgi:hypothetical protein